MKRMVCLGLAFYLGVAADVAEAAVRYVWKDNPGASVSPYTGGWATAATTIQQAVDVAQAGDTVLVTNGIYNVGARVAPGDTTLMTRLVITNAITVVSVNGPSKTLIVGAPHAGGADGLGNNAIRCAYLQTNSVLSGFTVTNGFTLASTSATTASYVGGGIRAEGFGAFITNCVIVANNAATRGGGVFFGTLSDCVVVSNAVINGSTLAGGGGVYSNRTWNSRVERNRAAGTSCDGGGAYGGSLVGCTLTGNSSGRNGGGAYTPSTVTNCEVRGNTAVISGGGIYQGIVCDTLIVSNRVTATWGDGGGFYGNAATHRLLGCTVEGNEAGNNGGGIYCATISNCVVRANRANGASVSTGMGGGAYAADTIYVAYRSRFLDNVANYRGGGAYQGMFYSCVFSGNRAAQGGGFYTASNSHQLNSCSVMGNSATNMYGGTYSGTLSNCIVYANTAVTSPNYGYGYGYFTSSCADPLPSGAGNTNVNPLVSGYDDPHLLPGSPCIGHGAVSGWMAGALDFDGEARASGGLTDMGADQFNAAGLTGPLTVSVTAVTNACIVGWRHAFLAEATGKVGGLSWNFGDGQTGQGVNPASHAFGTTGVYTVSATVTNGTHAATATYVITVVDDVRYVSPAGGHVAPFDTWAKAATNIQDAVDAVTVIGGRVLVTNGFYDAGGRVVSGQTVSNRLVLNKAVRVQSVNGPAGTLIVGKWHSQGTPLGNGAIRCVYIGSEAVLEGFTVTNGSAAASSGNNNGRGGGLFLAAGGEADNCVVSGCRAWSGAVASEPGLPGTLSACTLRRNAGVALGSPDCGGGAAGVTLIGCTVSANTANTGGGVYRCVVQGGQLTGNTATTQGGGAYDSTLDDCEIRGNSAASQGGGAYFGTLNRCRLYDNTATGTASGGGTYDATLYSCVVSGNSAYQGGGVYGSTATKGMFNCTVVGNAARVAASTPGGGGFYGNNGANYMVRNCIVYYNTSAVSNNLFRGAVQYSCATPLQAGPGNISGAPSLASFEWPLLLPGSPCIGAGLVEGWMAGALDFEGEPRTVGGTVDIGADEMQAGGTDDPLTVEIAGPAAPYHPGTGYSFEAEIGGHPASVLWEFGDGQGAANVAQVTHAWSEGRYTLRVTVSNATHSAEATLLLDVAPEARYVSLTGSHTPPFATWATAATNIQDAVDAAPWGGTVHVADGIYDLGGRPASGQALTNRICLEKSVLVRGANGAAGVIVRGAWHAPDTACGAGAVRGVYLGHAEARLEGITVEGGATSDEGETDGGGVYCAVGEASASHCVVTACTAAGAGGGVWGGTWSDSQISGNTASVGGGACEGVLADCSLTGNSASEEGGGCFGGTLYDCLLTNNVAVNGGGYCVSTEASSGELYRCRVWDNRATGSGGGVFGGTLFSCAVAGNAAAQSGGGTHSSTLESCSVLGNTAVWDGGGSYRGSAYNSIIYHNEAKSTPNTSETVCENSCTPVFGTVTVAPQVAGFREPHLLAGSPCIDLGVDREWMSGAEALDMDREARSVGAGNDIGADEREPSALSGPLAIEVFAETLSMSAGYAQSFRAEIGGLPDGVLWDFGDGTAATNQNPVSHTFTGAGVYAVRATVANGTDSVTAEIQVAVSAGEVFVSMAGTHEPPFATWETAATNIQEAVDVAPWGGTVHIAAGTYSQGGRPAALLALTNRVCVEKPVTVRSESGPAGVIVRGAWHTPETACGAGAVRGVYLGHREARLIGITVEGGATLEAAEADGGGVFCAFYETAVSNCVVTACKAAGYGGGVSGGSLLACQLSGNEAEDGGGGAYDASLKHCGVTGNTANWYGGGLIFCKLAESLIESNEALSGDGGGIYYSDAVRCTIRDNTAVGTGGGVNGGTLVSCLVANNRAYWAGGAAGSALINCTVVANEASHDAGGLGWCQAVNSIAWDNVAQVTSNTFESACSRCATTPLPEGEFDLGGNFDADPQFANPAGGNFRLLATSPCVNAGTNMPWVVGETDLDGGARFVYGIVDLGAYEYVSVEGFAALGTPIEWLDGYGLGPDWDAAELDDSDGDGFLTWEEYIAQTDPTDANSRFVIAATGRMDKDLTVSFDTAVGRVYTVQGSAGLGTAASWSDVTAPLAGNGNRMTVTVPVEGGSFFYRVRVALP